MFFKRFHSYVLMVRSLQQMTCCIFLLPWQEQFLWKTALWKVRSSAQLLCGRSALQEQLSCVRQQHLTLTYKWKLKEERSCHTPLHINHPESMKWSPSAAYPKYRQHTLLLQELQRPPLTFWEEALRKGLGVFLTAAESQSKRLSIWNAAGLPAQPAYSTGTLDSALTTQLRFLACFLFCLLHHTRPSTRIFPLDYSSSLLSGPLSVPH